MPAALPSPPELQHGGGAADLPPDDWDGGGDNGDDSDDEDFFAPGRRWVTLATFWHPAEAHIARLRLEAGGVVCVLFDELIAATNVFAIAVGGVKLQVPLAQRELALRLLRSARPDAAETDAERGVAVARFARARDATAAACVVEAAGLVAEVVPLVPTLSPWVGYVVGLLPPAAADLLRNLLLPRAEVRVSAEDLAAAAASLALTPFAAGLTRPARRARA